MINKTKSTAKTATPDYVQDVPYTWSFFDYQSPLLLSYVARLNGFDMPPISRPFTYCDLGCGNGVSVNLLAGAYPQAQFYGIDFNAEHIANAQTGADQGGLSNANFIAASFEDYAQGDPPKFDYIALHGIYSWVGGEVRAQIRDLIDKTLKPGGLVYVCYNTLPGWSELVPLWKMMQGYITQVDGDSLAKAKAGLANLERLRDSGAKYFRANPSASRYLDRLLARDLHYVAHEFCNGCFEPQYFIDVAQGLATCGLTYAGTAKIHRNNPANILHSKYLSHLEEAKDRLERESRASFIRNEFFRRDIYIRDSQPVPMDDRSGLFDDMIISANVDSQHLEDSVEFGPRTIDLKTSLYPTLKSLAVGGVRSVAEICDHADLAEYARPLIVAGLHDLLAGYQFQPVQSRAETIKPDDQTRYRVAAAVNRYFLNHRLMADNKVYLQSPQLGSALRLKLIYGMFTAAFDGHRLAEAQQIVEGQIERLGFQQQAKLGVTAHISANQWTAAQFARYQRQCLPRLIKFGILTET